MSELWLTDSKKPMKTNKKDESESDEEEAPKISKKK